MMIRSQANIQLEGVEEGAGEPRLLAAVLDLLRHEDPLFLDGDGRLSTSPEPAGEEERRRRSA